VDEVHRISNLEALYPVLDATRPRGWFAKNSVYAFTTTDEGRLPPAFRSRLVLVSLEPYSQAELAAIAYHERRLPDEALFEVARLARGSPRRAKLLVRLCKSATSASQVRAMLRHVGYSGGLSSRERTLLNLLRDGPKSIATLASMMGTSHNTVKQLESDLIAAGLVQIDHRGRSLTSHGFGVTGGSQ
jgi:Holliday junction resolvasome RuvABC ATP-dependent DNA helicase subunit